MGARVECWAAAQALAAWYGDRDVAQDRSAERGASGAVPAAVLRGAVLRGPPEEEEHEQPREGLGGDEYRYHLEYLPPVRRDRVPATAARPARTRQTARRESGPVLEPVSGSGAPPVGPLDVVRGGDELAPPLLVCVVVDDVGAEVEEVLDVLVDDVDVVDVGGVVVVHEVSDDEEDEEDEGDVDVLDEDDVDDVDVVDELDVVDVADVVDELDVVDEVPVPHAPAPASAVAERVLPFATTAFLYVWSDGKQVVVT